MKILSYIIGSTLYGAKELLSGVGVIVLLFVFFIALIIPPIAAFDAFVDNNMWHGGMWTIITLFIYGIGFRL